MHPAPPVESTPGPEEAKPSFANGKAILLIVDDDPSVRRSLSRLARSVGLDAETFASAEEFSRRETPRRPCCVLLDVRMPGCTGLELQRQLERRGLELPIVFMTGHGGVPESVQAMKGGAVDFLTKPFVDEDLLAAVREALERDVRGRERRAEARRLQDLVATLTDREREVFELVATGLLNKQVAGRLGISEKTVKVHRGRVMHKLRADSLVDLADIARQLEEHRGMGGAASPV